MSLAVVGLLAQSFPLDATQATPPATATATAPAKAATAPGGERIAAQSRPSIFGEIQGKALDSANLPLARRVIRLRATRNGKVADTKLTDDLGAFTFTGIEPGNYVVELVGNREEVLAASPLLTIDSGAKLTTVVKLPVKTPSLSGLLGNKVSTAAIIAGTAAAAGVLSVQPTDCVSPPCQH